MLTTFEMRHIGTLSASTGERVRERCRNLARNTAVTGSDRDADIFLAALKRPPDKRIHAHF